MLKITPALTLVALLCTTSVSNAQLRTTAPIRQPTLFSQTSIEKAWKRATQQQQPMLVMFTSDNCKYCKKMLAETYGHPAIQQMLGPNTQTVLAHKEDYEALVKKLGIRGYPSSVLISPKGDVLDFVEGFLPPKEFAQRVSPLLRPDARSAKLPKQTAGR